MCLYSKVKPVYFYLNKNTVIFNNVSLRKAYLSSYSFAYKYLCQR